MPRGIPNKPRVSKQEALDKKPGGLKPSDLREYDGPLYVENITPTTISHDDSKGNTLTLGPVYSQERYATLPLDVARHSGFQKIWRQGKVKVSSDPDMDDLLTLVSTAQMGVAEPFNNPAEAIIEEPAASKDLLDSRCMICSAQVFFTQAQLDEEPPLCMNHNNQAGLFTLENYYDEGEAKTRWVRPALQATRRV